MHHFTTYSKSGHSHSNISSGNCKENVALVQMQFCDSVFGPVDLFHGVEINLYGPGRLKSDNVYTMYDHIVGQPNSFPSLFHTVKNICPFSFFSFLFLPPPSFFAQIFPWGVRLSREDSMKGREEGAHVRSYPHWHLTESATPESSTAHLKRCQSVGA